MANDPEQYYQDQYDRSEYIGSKHKKGKKIANSDKNEQFKAILSAFKPLKKQSDINRLNIKWILQPKSKKDRLLRYNEAVKLNLLNNVSFKMLEDKRSIYYG